ncbi:mRNA guanylyltransferase [Saccharomycopsis crataegensis]|uniref:mRNA-capping enzyme subunit alpha n=1 Tax=Saccharomycopsis crataegensis TaxID=43959 RepID=A0AAV5QVP4_9ASCO|nr:mRNA guanylyltransferase [Saccharomycopsis crataegensis]
MFEDRDVPEMPGILQPDNVAFDLKQTVAQMLGLKRFDRFPGSQPVSFERKHIAERLMKHDYYVCEKSDGLRCLMLILADSFDGRVEEGVFLINRSYEFYRVPNIHFPISKRNLIQPHNGTLVDGELVLDKRPDGTKELRYLVFDLLTVNGTSYTSRPTDRRLAHINDLIEPYYEYRKQYPEESAGFAFKVTPKKMSTCSKIPRILDSLPHLPHISDGLVFTCCETPYVFETDSTLLKWKPAEENTIDFRIELKFKLYKDEIEEYYDYDSKPKIELHVWKGDRNYDYFGDLSITDHEWEELKKLEQPLNLRVAEVKKNNNGDWNILRFRDDKEHGNHYTVVRKILQSIGDGVSSKELVQTCPEIERSWIRRAAERKQMAMAKQGHRAPPPQQNHVSNNRSNSESDEIASRKRAAANILPTYDFEDDDDDDDVDEVDVKRRKG